jgi:hypothetical protein
MLQSGLLFRRAGDLLSPVESPKQPAYREGESPLVRLYMRKDASGQTTINAMQFAAGEKLRSDYERAHLERRITTSWEQFGAGGSSSRVPGDNQQGHLADSAIAARQRLHAACDAVGPELAGILYHVCCLTAGIEQAERILAVPQRSGKAILSLALTRLARHYGLIKATGSVSNRNIGHWAAEGYRPVITPQVPPAHLP